MTIFKSRAAVSPALIAGLRRRVPRHLDIIMRWVTYVSDRPDHPDQTVPFSWPLVSYLVPVNVPRRLIP
jgi:hypothetical protein